MLRIINHILIYFIFLFGKNVYANQLFPHQLDRKAFEEDLKKYDSSSAHMYETNKESEYLKNQKEGPTPNFSTGKKKSIDDLLVPTTIDSGNTPYGMLKTPQTYSIKKDKDIYLQYYDKGKAQWGFTYIKDSYDYKDSGDVFKKTYEEGTGSQKAGILLISTDYFLGKSAFRSLIEINFGVGYNTGKGVFIDGTQSNTKFFLYTLPLDFGFGLDMRLSSYIKFTVSGGPSAMGLLQNRGDKAAGEKNKNRRQISYGYYGMGKFLLNLSRIFPSTGRYMIDSYEVTGLHLTLTARLQNYKNFQDDDISISGVSLGIGFTFEFI